MDTARKAKATLTQLTPAEKQWLEEATRKIIYRMGQHAAGVPLMKLTLSELPAI